MGSCCCCISRLRHLPLLFLSFLLLCSTQMRFLAEGRPFPEPLQGAKKEADEKVMVRAMIGSRPPRCERRCGHCGHCEAVQVPAVPQDRIAASGRHISTGIDSRGDDNSSNYKPVSWKCKCGDTIMNP